MGDDTADKRLRFDAKLEALRGRRVLAVEYFDIHEPEVWDYGDWHHAVMGVQLTTDGGPVTVIWTATFYPYGVEVFLESIDHHLVFGEMGAERIVSDTPSRWMPLVAQPIREATADWETFTVGPTMTMKGDVIGPAYTVDVPLAIRLDFDAGAVWFVAAMPQWPAMEDTFVPGDEIMVVFDARKMRQMGFTD